MVEMRRANNARSLSAPSSDARVPNNPALTIDRDKGEYHLARLKASSAHDAAKGLNDLLESRMPEVELIDALIDVDNETDFLLRHFLQIGGSRLPPAIQRRNVLAALVAVARHLVTVVSIPRCRRAHASALIGKPIRAATCCTSGSQRKLRPANRSRGVLA